MPKTKGLFLLFFCLSLTSFLSAQTNIVSGYVTDAKNGERLIGATVYDQQSGKGSVANSYGFYSIAVASADSVCLVFSYVGYESQKIVVAAKGETRFDIEMRPNATLDEVIVSAEKVNRPLQERIEMSVVSIPMHEVKKLPALGGESDVLKAVQLMPGVQSGNEGTSGIYVRGGSPDQNLMILDEVPLYYVNHLGGFVSIFNTDAISQVDLLKGGFPARYGNRLSSVMDVRMKDGNSKEFHGNAMIGLVAAKASVEGPIKRDTSSYLVSFRRFMYDIITRPLSKIVFGNVSEGYTFFDFNAKLKFRLSEKDEMFLSLYAGNDRIVVNIKEKRGDYSEKLNKSWGNKLAALRWNHVFNPRLFCNTTLSFTRYNYQTKTDYHSEIGSIYDDYSEKYFSNINDLMLKIAFEYYHSNNYKLLFGVSSVYHNFRPSVEKRNQILSDGSSIDTVFGDYSLNAFENAAYVENIVRITENISFNAGLRLSHYAVQDTNFIHLEPRFLLNWKIGEKYSVKASYSKMNQNIHLLTNSGAGMPTDLWMPATKTVVPESSSQCAIGFVSTQYIGRNTYSFSLEMFHKRMENLISYKAGINSIDASYDWQKIVDVNGKGTSKGIELLAKKETGRTTGWVGCTFSRTTRRFDEINNGNVYLFKYDRPVDISVAVMHQFSENINASMTWVYGTGSAISMPVGAYSIVGEHGLETVFIYDGINTFRMRPYHRLDVGISFEKQKKHGVRVWNVSIYNAYNRMNPYYYYFEFDEKNNKVEVIQVTLFPIMPSVSYEFRF